MAEKPIANASILAVFPERADRMLLADIFADSNWKLRFTSGFAETQITLNRSAVGVVISEASLPDGHCWRDLLRDIQKLEDPPPLIVADRLADERLWAEVLNLGAYDLLAKPFDRREVMHAVTTACRRSEGEVLLRRRQVAQAASLG